jgi:hypothetical protein
MCRPTKRPRPVDGAGVGTQQFELLKAVPAVSCSSSSSSSDEERPKTFVYTTYDMLMNPENAPYIGFAASGREIEVRDSTVLSEKILPRYFRHKNVTSFYRQLNSYGFRTTRSAADVDHTFVHDIFQRDRPDLLTLVVRKKAQESTVVVVTTTPVVVVEETKKQSKSSSSSSVEEIMKMIEELRQEQAIQEQRARELEIRNRRLSEENQRYLSEGQSCIRNLKDLMEGQSSTINQLFGEEAFKAFLEQAKPQVEEILTKEMEECLPTSTKMMEDCTTTSGFDCFADDISDFVDLPGDSELALPDQDLAELETLLTFDELMG